MPHIFYSVLLRRFFLILSPKISQNIALKQKLLNKTIFFAGDFEIFQILHQFGKLKLLVKLDSLFLFLLLKREKLNKLIAFVRKLLSLKK